ncbi:NAD+ diphosphatase [Alteromonadaceae bacterium Bs31]|nr:NAD+ diphosphatase [Alteromonadaceae bacterium Bs31]
METTSPALEPVSQQCVLVHQNKILVDSESRFIFSEAELSRALGSSLLSHAAERFSLSERLFLYRLPSAQDCGEFVWVRLRELLGVLSEANFQLAGRAIQISHWHMTHRYCGRCGSPTVISDEEFRLDCEQCEINYFPRISPCVIGLITRGEECLLARGVRHPEPMFSTLAGFIEVGENAEQAFVREVKEEVSVHVHKLQYAGSQPWPFPGQLMIAFTAEYLSGEIVIDPKEIVEAKWFHYDNLPLVPPEHSIAGRLIQSFVRSHR